MQRCKHTINWWPYNKAAETCTIDGCSVSVYSLYIRLHNCLSSKDVFVACVGQNHWIMFIEQASDPVMTKLASIL